jgi:hypothetical protein
MEVVFTDVDADTLCTEHFIDPAYWTKPDSVEHLGWRMGASWLRIVQQQDAQSC